MRRMYSENQIKTIVNNEIDNNVKKYYKHSIALVTDATQLEDSLSIIYDASSSEDILMSKINSFKLGFTIINSSPDPITSYDEFKIVDIQTGIFEVTPRAGQGALYANGAVYTLNTEGFPSPDDYDITGYLNVSGVLRTANATIYLVGFSYDDDNIYEYTDIIDVVTPL